MFRAGLRLSRRLIVAASLLIFLTSGAEVAVRIYEATTGDTICRTSDRNGVDPSKLSIPSWAYYQELKPLAVSKVACRDSQKEIEIRTNSLGLRGAELAIPKPPDLCRIVVLGDETILAPETPDSIHFCTLLQNVLQQQTRMKIEVVNAGIPGHCPLSEFVLYKQRLMNLQPDLVLLHFDWSDVSDDRQMRRVAHCDPSGIPQSCPHVKLVSSKKLKQCEVWRQQFRLLDFGLSRLSDGWTQQLAKQKASSRDVDTNPYAWLRDEHPEQNVVFRQAVRPIADLDQLCRSSHSPLVLMTTPKPWQVSAKCSRGEGVRLAAGVAREACFSNRAPFSALAKFAESLKVTFIDGSTILSPGRDAESNFLRHAPRWSATGHRQLADFVASSLIEKVPGAWNSPYFQQSDQPVTQQDSADNAIQWTSGEKPSRNWFDDKIQSRDR